MNKPFLTIVAVEVLRWLTRMYIHLPTLPRFCDGKVAPACTLTRLFLRNFISVSTALPKIPVSSNSLARLAAFGYYRTRRKFVVAHLRRVPPRDSMNRPDNTLGILLSAQQARQLY